MQLMSLSGVPLQLDESALAEFAMALRGPLLRPGDDGYDNARVIFNGMFDRRPGLIVRCRGTADVMDAVQFARRHELLLSVRGGGHNVAGNAVCDDGMMIDLSGMTGVHVDRRAGTVRVQGGATWADVDRETQMFGLATPGGVVSGTGVAGLTLNGGIGWLRNKYGLSCDNLVSAEVLTAAGELITASATEHDDLFWALRGGGGNFGVVTSFEFKVHPVGPLVAAAFPMYRLETAPDVMRQWHDWVATAPPEVTSELVMWTMPVDPGLPPSVHGQAVVVAGGVYAGPADDGLKVLQPLREFGQPVGEIVGALPFRIVQSAFDPFFPKTGDLLSYWKSLYLPDLREAVIERLAERALHRPSDATMMVVQHFGDGVRRVPVNATAFATREAPFLINFMGTWQEPAVSQRHIEWVRDAWNGLSPYSTGAVYLNYLGREEQDAETLVHGAFGANYARLVEVKTTYDPTNLFRLNQNIKPKR